MKDEKKDDEIYLNDFEQFLGELNNNQELDNKKNILDKIPSSNNVELKKNKEQKVIEERNNNISFFGWFSNVIDTASREVSKFCYGPSTQQIKKENDSLKQELRELYSKKIEELQDLIVMSKKIELRQEKLEKLLNNESFDESLYDEAKLDCNASIVYSNNPNQEDFDKITKDIEEEQEKIKQALIQLEEDREKFNKIKLLKNDENNNFNLKF